MDYQDSLLVDHLSKCLMQIFSVGVELLPLIKYQTLTSFPAVVPTMTKVMILEAVIVINLLRCPLSRTLKSMKDRIILKATKITNSTWTSIKINLTTTL